MIIGIDFDGTCVEHEFPNIGDDIPGAVSVLRALVDAGHLLILYTMRSDVVNPTSNDPDIVAQPGEYLTQAIKWFTDKRIHLYAVNSNPTQHTWTTSPKVYCDLYIDDAALGVPLVSTKVRPYVDWGGVYTLLTQRGIL
jgi:hypothetical protein